MARIDSILSILARQGANELRVAVEKPPKMLAFGSPKKLSIPKMSEETLRELLGEILSPELDTTLRAGNRCETVYEAGAIGVFKVTFTPEEGGGFEAAFVTTSAEASTSERQVSRPAQPPNVSPDKRLEGSDLFRGLLGRAAAARASDLHLADGEPAYMRVDGSLRRADPGPCDVASLLGLSIEDRDRLARGRSIDRGMDLDVLGKIRAHIYTADSGLAAAVRLLPPHAPSFASLRMPIGFEDLARSPHGLVLVCGAAGSGKSTTLAALADEALQKRSIVLVTLEDPIEYRLTPSDQSLVRRRQVGRDAADFASGLRDALREDPDVLLVGEMRDPETIALALTAAETGHLVLASMHSRSAASAVERIVDAYAPARQHQIRVQLADALRAVISQRLLPHASGVGRIPAVEVMRVNHAIANMIREGKTAQLATAVQSGRSEGMLSLERCLADYVRSGDVRIESAREAANDIASFALLLEGQPAARRP